MSRYSLLYYPGFHPEMPWLRKVLLLADEVIRIVPSDVDVHDTDEVRALREAVPGSLGEITPRSDDVAFEEQELPRLRKAFKRLSGQRRFSKKFETIIHIDGSIEFPGYVFLHKSKVSDDILALLRESALTIDASHKRYRLMDEITRLPREGFMPVDAAASNLILAGLASHVACRTGLDTITDKSLPFALNALNTVDVQHVADMSVAQGALLASLASVLIPGTTSELNLRHYRELRDSFADVRNSFKALTATMAAVNRLGQSSDAAAIQAQVDGVAQEFLDRYREYRRSRYARGFKTWMPFCVGGVLSVVATVVDGTLALGVAGASIAIQVVEKCLEKGVDGGSEGRVFHMLAGLRRDIVRRSGINELI